MKSAIVLQCPVTNKRAKVPYAEGEEGVFEVVETEDAIDLPVGWGRVVIEVVIDNPEVAEVKAAREAELEAAMVEVQAAATDKRRPAEQRAQIKEQLDSGQALADATALVADRHPEPAPKALSRLQYPVLSDEAIGALLLALSNAGFTVKQEIEP